MLSFAKNNANKYEYVTLQASPLSIKVFKKYGFKILVPYEIFLKYNH